jgi:hypothetical protein
MPRRPHQGEIFRFKIDAWTPTKIPMLRLAEYMQQLAQILGEPGQVHFHRLAKGSTVIVSKIENEAVPKVRAQVVKVRNGEAPAEAQRAYDVANRLLREDNGVGTLRGGGAIILPFPGRNESKEKFESVRQQGFVDGIVTGIRGGDDSAHFILRMDGKQVAGFRTTNRAVAKQLAGKWDEPIRLFGRGRWQRDDEGNWTLLDFRVDNFESLDDTPLTDVLAELRKIPTEWNDNSYSELETIRHGPRGKRNGGH